MQIFTTVLGFGLWLGLVGIVDIRNSGPKSLFHACFVCTLIFLLLLSNLHVKFKTQS